MSGKRDEREIDQVLANRETELRATVPQRIAYLAAALLTTIVPICTFVFNCSVLDKTRTAQAPQLVCGGLTSGASVLPLPLSCCCV
jgi:hypothetical protein